MSCAAQHSTAQLAPITDVSLRGLLLGVLIEAASVMCWLKLLLSCGPASTGGAGRGCPSVALGAPEGHQCWCLQLERLMQWPNMIVEAMVRVALRLLRLSCGCSLLLTGGAAADAARCSAH